MARILYTSVNRQIPKFVTDEPSVFDAAFLLNDIGPRLDSDNHTTGYEARVTFGAGLVESKLTLALVPQGTEMVESVILSSPTPRVTIEGVVASNSYTLLIPREALIPFEGQTFDVVVLNHA